MSKTVLNQSYLSSELKQFVLELLDEGIDWDKMTKNQIQQRATLAFMMDLHNGVTDHEVRIVDLERWPLWIVGALKVAGGITVIVGAAMALSAIL